MLIMIIPLLITLISTPLAKAQYHQHTPTSANFQPSLFVVIGVLSFMFSLTLILVIYAKFCHTHPSAIHNISRNENNTEGIFANSTRFSGIDKNVVEALPFFRFSSLKGSKQGLQCAVCLAEFEEVEILRLLPKCKHGFHIQCVDQWLEHHSTCPLCRQKISVDDLKTVDSSSMRFIIGGQKSERLDDGSGNFEILLQREINSQSSSRFSSFRRVFSAKREEEMYMQLEKVSNVENDQDGKVLHSLSHQIIVSDVVFKHRWSDVSSSDLMFLNSEMLGVMSSDGISNKNNSFDEIERFELCNSKIRLKDESGIDDSRAISMDLDPPRSSKRSMSEITALSRFKELKSMKNNSDDYLRDEDIIKRRNKWFTIAKKTVQWFANREKNRSRQQQQQEDTNQTIDV